MKLAIDHSTSVPLHLQVEQLIRKLAGSAAYRDGNPLPPEEKLALQLGVSRATVRQAMGRLVQEGLLTRKRNAGTRVAERQVVTSLSAWDSFSHEMDAKGLPFITLYARATLAAAPEDIAEGLGIAAETQLVRLERLKGRGDPVTPAVLFVSWFHPRIGLKVDEDFNRPLYEILEKDLSVVPMFSSEKIGACLADRELARVLQYHKGEAVLTRRRLVLDPGRRPIEFCDCFYRADTFTYSIEIARSKQ